MSNASVDGENIKNLHPCFFLKEWMPANTKSVLTQVALYQWVALPIGSGAD